MSLGHRTNTRILIVIRQFFPHAAGAETQALRQAQSYIRMGHPTTVVTARFDAALPARDVIDNVPVVRLPAPQVRLVGSIVFLVSLAAHLVRHSHEYDAVLAFHLKQSAMVAALVGRLLRKRVVISDQGAGAFGDMHALRSAPLGRIILWGCMKASAFISGSSDITDELVSAGIAPRHIRFIPNGVPLDRFTGLADRAQARARLGIPRNAFTVVNVGRQTAQKDLKTLLSGWREFLTGRTDALLLLVGDGDERAQLEKHVSQWGLTDSVRFEGWRQNVPDYLAAADVFASSSISEGTHLALGEAMAAGLPVVATPVGGARDYIVDGRSGLLFRVGDSRALASVLSRLASDRTLRAQIGEAASAAARRLLEQDETARRHLSVLFGPAQRQTPTRRIKVTQLIATLDRGGSEGQMAELAARLDKNRFDCDVLCLTRGGPGADILDKASVPYHVIGKGRKLDCFAFFRLFRLLLVNPPNILHTWLFTSNAYGRLAALLAGVQNVVAGERSTDPWKSSLHRAVDRCLAITTRRIVANSRSVADSLAYAGIPRAKLTIIPNGLDTNRFRPMDMREARVKLGLPADGPFIGYVGRLAFEKRPEVFIQVAAAVLSKIPRARAVLFGEGPMQAELQEQAGHLGERVVFYGDCAFPELCHSAIDCLVLTSKWEGFPNVLLEAMACARPVVAVRMPATEEIVEDGKTGALVDDSVDAIADAVKGILSSGRRGAEMGRLGRKEVESLYSMGKMVTQYEGLYTGLLSRAPITWGNA